MIESLIASKLAGAVTDVATEGKGEQSDLIRKLYNGANNLDEKLSLDKLKENLGLNTVKDDVTKGVDQALAMSGTKPIANNGLAKGLAVWSMLSDRKASRENKEAYDTRMQSLGNSDFKFKDSIDTNADVFGINGLNNVIGTDPIAGGFGIGQKAGGLRYEEGGEIDNDDFQILELTDDEIDEYINKGAEIEFLD